MPDKKKIAGAVLAGGRSSRMGQDKALLNYHGVPLLDHIMELLRRTGLTDIYVSGDFEDYRCISDSTLHAGPAHAIADVLLQLNDYDAVLFVPVDMPLLHVDALKILMKQRKGGYFMRSPLPVFITKPYVPERFNSVKDLLAANNIHPVALPENLKSCMNNTNTPEEWAEALRA